MSRPARPHGARALAATALSAAATGAALLALTGLIQGTQWLRVGWVAILVVAATCTAVRAVTRSWWAPTLGGLLVAVAGLLVRYGPPPGRIQVLPDLASFDRTRALAREGVRLVNDSLTPMPDVRPGELLVVTGAVAVLLLVDLLAVGLGAPAWAGLPLAALWLPSISLGVPANARALGWTGLAYLLLLALSSAPSAARGDGTRRAGTAVASAGAVVVATLVAGPVVAALPGAASWRLPDFGSGPAGPLQLSDNLDLRQSLGSRSGQVVLRYTVAGQEATEPAQPSAGASAAPVPPAVTARTVGPLRAFTLTTFDGQQWQREDGELTDGWPVEALLSSDPEVRGTAPDANRGTLAQVSVEVGSLREQHLPVSTFPRTVDAPGSWGYDELRDEIVGERGTFDGMHYDMVVEVPSLTKDELRGQRVGDPRDDGASLTLPETSHSDDVAALAQDITADATSPYEQAVDLQTYFRASSNFVYDTRVAPARTNDAVWDFLQSRRGYCVQFATSMVVMARSLGIPARLGIGFLPGDSDPSGRYVVTGRKAHAWPELYFEGSGWVRFEPTPAVQTGAPPVWSDPFASVAQPSAQPTEAEPSALAPTDVQTQQPGAAPRSATQDTGSHLVTIGVVVGFVLVAALLGLAVIRRRVRPGAELTPERAWLKVRRRLATRGVTWTDATTPRGVVSTVEHHLLDVTGNRLGDQAATALESLARTVERERYARQPAPFDSAQLERWVDELVHGVETLLDEPSASADRQPTPSRTV